MVMGGMQGIITEEGVSDKSGIALAHSILLANYTSSSGSETNASWKSQRV